MQTSSWLRSRQSSVLCNLYKPSLRERQSSWLARGKAPCFAIYTSPPWDERSLRDFTRDKAPCLASYTSPPWCKRNVRDFAWWNPEFLLITLAHHHPSHNHACTLFNNYDTIYDTITSTIHQLLSFISLASAASHIRSFRPICLTPPWHLETSREAHAAAALFDEVSASCYGVHQTWIIRLTIIRILTAIGLLRTALDSGSHPNLNHPSALQTSSFAFVLIFLLQNSILRNPTLQLLRTKLHYDTPVLVMLQSPAYHI